MRKVHLFMSMALLLSAGAAMVSCNNDDITNGNHANGDISFAIGFAPQTRVSTDADFKSTWEDGDAIGVYAVVHGNNLSATASGNHIHNAKLTYSSGTWTQESLLYWPSGSNSTLDFYAYYPYDAGATNPTAISFNVKTDQSGETAGKSNYNLSDLLMVKSDNSGNGWVRGYAVDLKFSHALAMVQVSVPKGDLTGSGPSENLTVTLRGVQTEATLNLNTATTATTTSGTATSITMYRVEQPGAGDYETTYTYRALVPAQTVAAGNKLFWFEHEKRQLFMDDALATALQMTAGKAETFERTLTAAVVHTVPVPAAGKTFSMGEAGYAEPIHDVTFTKDFYMSKYQITNAQYAVFLNTKGIDSNGSGNVTYYKTDFTTPITENQRFIVPHAFGVEWDIDKWVVRTGYENHPVINVTWFGAKAYSDWAGGVLPTEAQWEYACRGGTTTAFYFGDNETDMGDYGWSYENSPDYTKPVGRKTPNAYGLYDMHGNVWEWCSDWYAAAYSSSSVTDPAGSVTGASRVLRGGGWDDDAQYCRSAFRHHTVPDSAYSRNGFRLAFVP